MSFIDKIKQSPESISFSEVISHIDSNFDFTPTRFTNGDIVNEANQNNGSCKIFSFAKLESLNLNQTLNLFGDYFRKDVLENPAGEDHQNIRNFMKFGWEGISFDGEALRKK
jgi:DNA-binding IscR family transcriptional regulator